LNPFKIGNSSFMVNITILNSINISTVAISYVIFSPIYAGFTVVGDQIVIQPQ
jgi:hypothetical protein